MSERTFTYDELEKERRAAEQARSGARELHGILEKVFDAVEGGDC